jgi:tripartite-type tricarboxylate transporter receptor subunit TctC
LGLSAGGSATAEVYPQRPVKIITAGIPGTPFDLIARALADQLSSSFKQTFLVETRPGAAGNVGAEFVAKAPADGYTLISALGTTFTVNPSLYKKPPFDPLADFRFIAIMAVTGNMLVVHPSIPVNSVAEFVAYARKERIAYAHGGNGSPGHLAMEYFRLMAEFPATPVPYRVAAQADHRRHGRQETDAKTQPPGDATRSFERYRLCAICSAAMCHSRWSDHHRFAVQPSNRRQ